MKHSEDNYFNFKLHAMLKGYESDSQEESDKKAAPKRKLNLQLKKRIKRDFESDDSSDSECASPPTPSDESDYSDNEFEQQINTPAVCEKSEAQGSDSTEEKAPSPAKKGHICLRCAESFETKKMLQSHGSSCPNKPQLRKR